MKAETKRRIKAAIERMDAALWVIVRRWAFRQLRKLVDVADDRLQAAQVKLRKEIAETQSLAQEGYGANACGSTVVRPIPLPVLEQPAGKTYAKWEARKSGVASVTKKSARRHHRLTAAEFDRQFA